MWKSVCVGVYQLLNWKMHGETLKNSAACFSSHEPSSGTSHYNILKHISTSTLQQAIVLLVRSHYSLVIYYNDKYISCL